MSKTNKLAKIKLKIFHQKATQNYNSWFNFLIVGNATLVVVRLVQF